MRPTLVVMVKEPRPGRVKTRLGRDIGMTTAAWWFRHQTRALIQRVTDPRWRLVLAVSPDVEGLQSRVWPVHVTRRGQGQGNLGDRMARALYAHGPGPVAIIGADIPGIHPHHIARAFKSLGSYDAVFGPAPDGGYWLVGLKRPRQAPPSFFQGVRWSSAHALSDSIASLPRAKIALIDELQDVDTLADLRAISR